MAVVYKEYPGKGPRVILTECPACGYEFSGGQNRSDHLLHEHGPEDFGLSPMGGAAP